jgi:porphobilinogen synthase
MEKGFTLRRVRFNEHIRELCASVVLNHKKFIQPIFVKEGLVDRIETMPNVFIENVESVIKQIELDVQRGISKFLLFPIPKTKDCDFTFACSIISKIKERFSSSIWLACDVCLCSSLDTGHCGVLSADASYILNSESIDILEKMALEYAKSGADCIAPSDMMDSRVFAIRSILNYNGFDYIPIMSYSTKFSSAFYGPFRDTCGSSPSECGVQDRKSYQIDFRNVNDAMSSSLRDVDEGADILMVKPVMLYLDIVAKIKLEVMLPIAGYHVSGEYVALELLVKNGYAERHLLHLETWFAMVRAGCDVVISYAAREAKNWILNI